MPEVLVHCGKASAVTILHHLGRHQHQQQIEIKREKAEKIAREEEEWATLKTSSRLVRTVSIHKSCIWPVTSQSYMHREAKTVFSENPVCQIKAVLPDFTHSINPQLLVTQKKPFQSLARRSHLLLSVIICSNG